jgi:hypothetical protein
MVTFALFTLVSIIEMKNALSILLRRHQVMAYFILAYAFLWAIEILQRRSALIATLMLGVAWAPWHLPALFYKDTYVTMGLAAGLPLLLLSILAASIIFTWLYNSTGGSLLVTVGVVGAVALARRGNPAAH